jgi:hypothetical protein
MIERPRYGADNWGLASINSVETSQSYTLDIFAGAVLVRTVNITATTYTYSSANVLADFGTTITELRISLTQNNFVGRGRGLNTTVLVDRHN